MNLIFASHNRHKVKEVREMLDAGVRLSSLSDLGYAEDIPESGATLEENSAIKAFHVFRKFRKPCFADDSGLEVDALQGAPGVYSARYAGQQRDDALNIKKILGELEGIRERQARFRAVFTFVWSEVNMKQFEGVIKGSISSEPKGNGGFGYDPIFIPNGCDKTFAELPAGTKKKISHRAAALNQFLAFIIEFYGVQTLFCSPEQAHSEQPPDEAPLYRRH